MKQRPAVRRRPLPGGPLNMLADSAELRVYSAWQWQQEKHG
jgi:hypothetical protein